MTFQSQQMGCLYFKDIIMPALKSNDLNLTDLKVILGFYIGNAQDRKDNNVNNINRWGSRYATLLTSIIQCCNRC